MVIEELYMLGNGVVEETNGDTGRAIAEWLTAMNPYLPKTVGILNTQSMQITAVLDLRSNKTAARSYVIYMSGANDDPSNMSPAFKADKKENIVKAMNTLLKWDKWPDNYKNAIQQIKNNASNIATSAKSQGVKYVVISFDGKDHASDSVVQQYILERLREKLMEKVVKGTCIICCEENIKVTGSALRLANLKFATPDKEVFMPFGINKDKAFSAQFSLCEKDAKMVMLGAAFAASETYGRLRGRIANIGNASYEYIVMPMPRTGKERDVVSKTQRHSPEEIAVMDDVEKLCQELGNDIESSQSLQQIYQQLMSPIEYISIYFTEKIKATTIIGSAKYVTPNILARLIHARSIAQISANKWFGRIPEHTPKKWMSRKNLFYDMVTLQITDEKSSENDVAIALKQAIQEYILALKGHWARAEEWLKRVITQESSGILLKGKDTRKYMRRGVIAVLTVESMRGDVEMTVDRLIEVVKDHPDQYVAFLAGLLSAEAMYLQRKEKNLHMGEEPFRKVVGNAATGDLEDFRRILVLAVDKINQYGGSPRWVLKDYFIESPETLNLKKTSKTEDLRFAFVFGLLVGETRFARSTKQEQEGGDVNGEEA